ncbi:MAG TPA: DUF5700 domain-containing putative Zn-dependent protease, partial [Anaeromyxobacteraceae bacterium]|nr:DUF5700 domain-containing putative Zn-dependent protease [Anaeromyxobacteraceae bacterium]
GASMLATILLAATLANSALDVRVDAAEAEHVLALLELRAAGAVPSDRDFASLFATEGYVRLKQREAAMMRPFTDAEFRAFVESDDVLARRAALATALGRWKRADLVGAAARAARYLPADARLRATVYLVIKPRPNSFVFELTTSPAIFFAVGAEDLSPAAIENTVAHELHHVGAASLDTAVERRLLALPEPRRTAAEWTGAFSEGIAVLAAAGGPRVHPHAASAPSARARWDVDAGRAEEDLRAVETFLLEVARGRLAGDAIASRGYRFHSDGDRPQGAWYTLGWRMAALVEEELGRDAVVACVADPPRLLASYQRVARRRIAAGERWPLWSAELLEAIGAENP